MHEAHMYIEYADYVGQGDTTRLEAAEYFGVSKPTATYHLERAVSEGLLIRFYSYTRNNQSGWGYRSASHERLPGIDGDSHAVDRDSNE